MRNDELPNINDIGNGAELRAKLAAFITHVQQYCNDEEKARAIATFSACTAAIPLSGG